MIGIKIIKTKTNAKNGFFVVELPNLPQSALSLWPAVFLLGQNTLPPITNNKVGKSVNNTIIKHNTPTAIPTADLNKLNSTKNSAAKPTKTVIAQIRIVRPPFLNVLSTASKLLWSLPNSSLYLLSNKIQ